MVKLKGNLERLPFYLSDVCLSFHFICTGSNQDAFSHSDVQYGTLGGVLETENSEKVVVLIALCYN